MFLLGLTSDDQQYQINYEHEQFGKHSQDNEYQTYFRTVILVSGDIIQENFIDSYNNLTLKSVFMLKWANRNCVNKSEFGFDHIDCRLIVN